MAFRHIVLAATGLFFVNAATGQDIAHLSAGVSVEDRAPQPAYSTKLIFFVESGAYLADIDVQIRTQSGEEVLRTTATGPWLFVDLDPGRYVVTASRKSGGSVSVAFSVEQGQTQREYALMFPGEQ